MRQRGQFSSLEGRGGAETRDLPTAAVTFLYRPHTNASLWEEQHMRGIDTPRPCHFSRIPPGQGILTAVVTTPAGTRREMEAREWSGPLPRAPGPRATEAKPWTSPGRVERMTAPVPAERRADVSRTDYSPAPRDRFLRRSKQCSRHCAQPRRGRAPWHPPPLAPPRAGSDAGQGPTHRPRQTPQAAATPKCAGAAS